MVPHEPPAVVPVAAPHGAVNRTAMIVGLEWIELERYTMVRASPAVARQHGLRRTNVDRPLEHGTEVA